MLASPSRVNADNPFTPVEGRKLLCSAQGCTGKHPMKDRGSVGFSSQGLQHLKGYYCHPLLGENKALAKIARVNYHKEPNPGILFYLFSSEMSSAVPGNPLTGNHCFLDRQPGKPQSTGFCPSMSSGPADKHHRQKGWVPPLAES